MHFSNKYKINYYLNNITYTYIILNEEILKY